jgi:Ni/Fe-hydrogenase subunit HybB-like protein
MSPTLEFLTVVFMFIVRVVVPVLIIFSILYVLKRWLEPRIGENGAARRISWRVMVPPLLIALGAFIALVVILVVGYALVTDQFIDLLMIFRDVAVVLYLFLLRLVVPFILVIGVGMALERKLNPEAARESRPLSERIPRLARLRVPRVSPRAILAVTFVAALWAAAIGVAVARFFFGLGAVTNLSDDFPWGLWISFDVISGVALAAGGFVIAGTVHVLNIKRFHPIVRPAILTAFLGYLLVIVGLLFDLGRWYNIWHPLFMWNIHSPMLEVGLCVVFYTTVLALEFSPIVLERFNLQAPLKIVRAVTIPLVILGVMLSTLHQSSLGALFLIVPEKINPLWYSPLLPILFFISAVAVGLGMVIVESNLSARAFGRELERDLLRDLGRAAAVVLGIYLIVKIADLIARGAVGYWLTPGFHSTLYTLEMLFGVLVPMVILATRRGRANPRALYAAAWLIVGGVVFNRLNVSLLGWWNFVDGGPTYFPSLGEFTITLSLVAAGVVVFGLAAKFLPVFTQERHAHA